MTITTQSASASPTSARQGYVFPASSAQQRLWFLHQFDPSLSVYNIPAPMRIPMRVDPGTLRLVLDEIVRRHESLRTTFTAVDGEPMQVVAPAQAAKLDVIDLRSLEPSLRQPEAQRLASADAKRPFSLTTGPLFRATLLILDEADCVLLLTMHHIVADGWSMGVLLRELRVLYDAFAAGKRSPLPELPIQYADYASWQRDMLKGEVFEQHLAYWKSNLAGAPTLLELPTDKPRPPFQSYRGDGLFIELDARLYDSVKALGRQHATTPFMTLLAAFAVLLSRYTGMDDIVVGSPIANRGRAELENMIGLFVNTLVLRTDLSGDPTFCQLLGRVREMTLGAYGHQDLPFERLVEELSPERNPSHNPLFQVMFILHSADRASDAGPVADDRPLDASTGTAKFDLTLSVSELGGGATAGFEYNVELFAADTIERLARQFRCLLESIVLAPERKLSELGMIDDDDRRLLASWNDTAAVRDAILVHHRIVMQARATPEATAVIADGERVTYQELLQRSNALASELRRMGVGPQVLVGICMERSVHLIVALLGTLLAGGAYVPLDPDYPKDRLELVLEDAQPRVLLTQEALLSRLPRHGSRVVCVDAPERLAAPVDRNVKLEPTHPEQWMYVIYTSGSTGRPKGAINTHRGVANRLHWGQETFGLVADDRVLQKTTISFDISVWELFWPLTTGATLVMATPGEHRDTDYVRRAILEHQITTVHFVPSMLRAFLEDPAVKGCRSLRRIIASGEALAPDIVALHYERLDVPLYNLYGPTEASVEVTCWPCRRGDQTVPIGRPIANTQIHVLDSRLEPTPIGVPGELYIGGTPVGVGYLRRPDLTAERFIPDGRSGSPGGRLYRTGDRARYRADGSIEYLGRLDQQEKIRGFRIELGEIEATLRTHHAVASAAVVAHEYAAGDKRIVAYVVPKRGVGALEGAELEEALRHHAMAKLPSYMVPTTVVELDALPLLPNGKLDRRSLPKPEGERATSAPAYTAPRTVIERQLVRLFEEALHRDRIGIHDDFFLSGGHSLLATRAIARIREAYGVSIPLRRFFEAPTVEALARAVVEAQSQGAAVAETRKLGSASPDAGPRAARADAPIRKGGEPDPAVHVAQLSDDEVTAALERLLQGGQP